MAVSSYFRSIPEIFADAANQFSILVRKMISRLGGGSVHMIRRSLLTSLFVLIATASLAAPPPVNPADAAAFMNQLWASAVEVLNKKADPAAREARFRQLFHEDFDCPGIARFVLGRYWRSASEEEQQEFVRLFEDYVVFVYTARLGDFGGETFKIRSSRSDGDGIIVSTDVFSPGSTSPLRIDWRLVTVNGVYKISDVIVEGVSMSVTQRSEFASVVQRNGGQLRGVFALMREKTARAAH
jgi:phospholipid transport system substrate-binding protein